MQSMVTACIRHRAKLIARFCSQERPVRLSGQGGGAHPGEHETGGAEDGGRPPPRGLRSPLAAPMGRQSRTGTPESNGSGDGDGSQRRTARRGPRLASACSQRRRRTTARDGSTQKVSSEPPGPQPQQGRRRAGAARGSQPAQTRGDAAAVVALPGSRVPDVMVDRSQRAS